MILLIIIKILNIDLQIEPNEMKDVQAINKTVKKIEYLKNNIDQDLKYEIAQAIIYYCERYNIPQNIAISIAFRQSGFRPDAMSYANCIGVFQVNPGVHSWIDMEKVQNVFYNTYCGLKILREYKNIVNKKYPDHQNMIRWERALVRYNGLVPGNPYGKWVLQIYNKLQDFQNTF